jgi:hypothetical protein
MRVVGWAVVRVLGGESIGVFIHVQGAHQHTARCAHALHQECILQGRCMAAVDLGARKGDLTLNVKQIFNRIGHTGQRGQCLTAGTPGVHSRRLAPCACISLAGECID